MIISIDPSISTDAALVGILLAGVSAIVAASALASKLLRKSNGSPAITLNESILKELAIIADQIDANREAIVEQNQDFLRHRIDLLNVVNDIKRHLERQDLVTAEIEKRGRGADKAIEAILNFTRGKQNG